jgi:uncharacterized cupredoxin-like copper-binding protein
MHRLPVALATLVLTVAGVAGTPAYLGAQAAPAKPAAAAVARPAARTAGAPITKIDLITVSGMDYAFSLPQTLNAGVVTFNLVNNGADLHAMTLLELPANHTLREFLDMYHDKGIIPPWMPAVGQTATIAPNQEAFLTARLKPGKYVLACLIPGRDGRAHTEKGMVQFVTVK